MTEAPEGIGNFLYAFRAAFKNYKYYYQLDPYKDTYLESDQIPAMRAFADSVLKWLSEHGAEENRVIQRYGESFQKIRGFAAEFSRVCDSAMEHGHGLVGIRD